MIPSKPGAEKPRSSVPQVVPIEPAQRTIQFGAFELGMDTGELRKNGLRVKLQGKAFQILQALLERPGGVVTREELKGRLWPSDTFVDFESGLNTAMNRLRLTLGDSAENPRFIETVARLGYRFVAPAVETSASVVETETPEQAPEAAKEAVAAPAPNRVRWILTGAGVSVAAVAVALLIFWGTRKGSPYPSFHQITFRSGVVSGARFAPDGETILYSARWDGATGRVFVANTVSPESRQLDFHTVRLAGVSSSDELALLTPTLGALWSTLLRVPLNGGAPFPVTKEVAAADWSPDGKTLAVIRIGSRESVVEYPLGKVLYKTAGNLTDLRFSPSGDALAFMDHPLRNDDGGVVKLLPLNGTAKDLTGNWSSVGGLAWSPSGKEVWFTAGQSGVRGVVYAVTRGGSVREVATLPGLLTLCDISKKGRVLINVDRSRLMMAGAFRGQAKERDLSYFDWTHISDISEDGKLVLFDETGNGGGPNHSVYLRNTETDSVVRLGDGAALALSPDQHWAAALDLKKRTALSLLPVGPEQPRMLTAKGMTYTWAQFFPDGKRLLVAGSLPGGKLHLFVQSINGGEPVPFTPDVYLSLAAISPDGKQIAGVDNNHHIVVVPAAGGEPRDLNLGSGGSPVQWSSDSKNLFVSQVSPGPVMRVYSIDVATGKSTLWKQVLPSDNAGLTGFLDIMMSSDQRSYAYSYFNTLSELFVFDGCN